MAESHAELCYSDRKARTDVPLVETDPAFTYEAHITSELLDLDAGLAFAASPAAGAVVSFSGTTRNSAVVDGAAKRVTHLWFDCSHVIAQKQLESMCRDAFERSGRTLSRVFICHRTGSVPVGEASVIVVVSSPHRRHALEAVAYLMDVVKSKLAVWKKECYDDGTSLWKENCECSWAT